MEDEKQKKGLRLKCPRDTCMYVWEYKGTNIHKTSCPKCAGSVYISNAVISRAEYNKRKEAHEEIVKEVKKKFNLD